MGNHDFRPDQFLAARDPLGIELPGVHDELEG